MSRKIFLGLLGLAILFVGYQVVSIYLRYAGIDDPGEAYVLSPEGANLSVVEFLDYDCVYCRQAHPTITQAMQEDGKIIYVPRIIPSDSEKAQLAAHVVYAAARQGKFFEMHHALIENYDMLDVNTLSYLAAQAGVDVETLRKDILDPSISEPIDDNIYWGARVGVASAPTFIIGKKLFYLPRDHMPTVQDFHNMFREARALWAIEG